MRKGDKRKADIINAAENLFYTKGYENTSIQDVLDALQLSKGGFYHHFESKLQLLEAISEKRAQSYSEECLEKLSASEMNVGERLSCVLRYASYLNDVSGEYISIMLEIAYKEGNVMLRDHMKMASVSLLHDMVLDIVEDGVRSNFFFVRFTSEITDIILNLAQCLTDDISLLAINGADDIQARAEVQKKVDAYTYAVETLLNAPHGAVTLMNRETVETLLKSAVK